MCVYAEGRCWLLKAKRRSTGTGSWQGLSRRPGLRLLCFYFINLFYLSQIPFFLKHVFAFVYLICLLCYLFANQSTLDCMQVLLTHSLFYLGWNMYCFARKPSPAPLDKPTTPSYHLLITFKLTEQSQDCTLVVCYSWTYLGVNKCFMWLPGTFSFRSPKCV